jgi:hypothetical protein
MTVHLCRASAGLLRAFEHCSNLLDSLRIPGAGRLLRPRNICPAILMIGLVLVFSACGTSDEQSRQAMIQAQHAEETAERAERAAVKAREAAEQAQIAADRAQRAVEDATREINRVADHIDQINREREEADK